LKENTRFNWLWGLRPIQESESGGRNGENEGRKPPSD
jgi:hypothetical protein